MFKKILQNWLERRISTTVLPEDVFSYNPKKGTMYLGSYLMTDNEIVALQEEIKFVERTRLWQVWQNTVRKQAIDTAIYNSTNFEDMRTAKAFLKVLGTFQDINTVINSWKPIKKKDNLPNQPIER